MAVTNETLSTAPYLRFFQQRVVRMVTHWRDHDAVQQLEVAYLDREREAILKAINLGLDFTPAWPLVKPLIVALTPYMERRGHWDAWEIVLQRARNVAKQEADLEAETTFTALLARLCNRMSKIKDVIYYYRQTIYLARRTGNRFEEARACSNLGYFYVDHGHWWRSRILSCHALTIFEALENRHGLAHTHNHLGVLYVRQRQWAQAEQHLSHACSIWEELEDGHSLIYGYLNLGLLHIERGVPAQAIPILHSDVELIERLGERSLLGNVLNNLSVAYRLTGNYTNAMQLARQAEAVYRQFSLGLELAQAQHNLGLIHLSIGEIELAKELLKAAKQGYLQFNYTAGLAMLADDWKALTTIDTGGSKDTGGSTND
ncbi:MAG TPA: tetratricopeptide repeat protein [Caldilineaceae bacterium]|nr:tetratricopeptide repeat protein [Caldilineaceae bacterium]